MRIPYLVLALVMFLIAGCNQQKTDNKNHQHETGKTGEASSAKTLTLNEGKKWQLDEPTRVNMKLIQETFKKTDVPKPDYASLAADLQTKSNKLVSECKMNGKDHEMLHLWLTEYLSALKEMGSTDPKVQETAFHKIETQLETFDQYFE